MTEEERQAFGLKKEDNTDEEREKWTREVHAKMGKMSILNHHIAEDIEQVMKENFEYE